MATIIRRTSFSLTKESERQLTELCDNFGENPSQVIRRALQLIHFSLRFPNIPEERKKAEDDLTEELDELMNKKRKIKKTKS